MTKPMHLGIVSDTHGRAESARAAANLLKSFEISQVIHCGDIGSTDVVAAFSNWPTHYVFGNCDTGLGTLRAAMEELGGTCHEWFGELRMAGRSIAFLHGDDSRRLRETIAAGTFDLVCHGHTHVAAQERSNGTLVLNPGALFRARPLTIAVVELPSLEVTTMNV